MTRTTFAPEPDDLSELDAELAVRERWVHRTIERPARLAAIGWVLIVLGLALAAVAVLLIVRVYR